MARCFALIYYDIRVREAVDAILRRFPAARRDESLWPPVKRAYIGLLYGHKRPECAETFFNSVACRVLDRTCYRNEYIFWRPAVSSEFVDADEPTYRCFYPGKLGFRRTLNAIVESFGLAVPFEDLPRDLRLVVKALRTDIPGHNTQQPNFQVQVLSSLFFRNTGAYIVGRVINGPEDRDRNFNRGRSTIRRVYGAIAGGRRARADAGGAHRTLRWDRRASRTSPHGGGASGAPPHAGVGASADGRGARNVPQRAGARVDGGLRAAPWVSPSRRGCGGG